MRSANLSRLDTAGISCRCWARAPTTARTMYAASVRSPPYARARRTKKPNCGCADYGTTPSSRSKCNHAAPLRHVRRNQDVVYKPRIVIPWGEPAGIGPDACVALAQSGWEADLVVAADAGLLAATADALNLPLN